MHTHPTTEIGMFVICSEIMYDMVASIQSNKNLARIMLKLVF